MGISIGFWMILIQTIRCYRVLFLPGLSDNSERKYIMNHDEELRLSRPTLENIPEMYVVVHRRHLLFYTRGTYYGLGLGEDRVNIQLVPFGLLGGEMFDYEAHSGIEYFTKTLADKKSDMAIPGKVKRWDTWSKEVRGKGEEASTVHEEEVFSGYGGKSAVRRTTVEEKIPLNRPKLTRIISAKEGSFHTGLRGNEGWEKRTISHRDSIIGDPAVGDHDERYGAHGHFPPLVDEVTETERNLVERNGDNVSTEHRVEISKQENAGHVLDLPLVNNPQTGDLINKLQGMIEQIKGKNVHVKRNDKARINEIESDSEIAEKTNLDILVHTLDYAQRTFNLKSKNELCVTLYKSSFILAECTNAPGQIFKMDDAGAIVRRLKKEARPRKRTGSSEWEEVGKKKGRIEESKEDEETEPSDMQYDNDKRYDEDEWNIGDKENRPPEGDRGKQVGDPLNWNKGSNDEMGNKTSPLGSYPRTPFGNTPPSNTPFNTGSPLNTPHNRFSSPKMPFNSFPSSNMAGPSPIPKYPLKGGGSKPAHNAPSKNSSHILDKLQEVLDKNTF